MEGREGREVLNEIHKEREFNEKLYRSEDNYFFSIVACMTKLPYPDNYMSAAVIIHVLEHNSPTDRINILKEARRVVKQGKQ